MPIINSNVFLSSIIGTLLSSEHGGFILDGGLPGVVAVRVDVRLGNGDGPVACNLLLLGQDRLRGCTKASIFQWIGNRA